MELVRKLQELIKEVQKYVDEQAKAHKKVRSWRIMENCGIQKVKAWRLLNFIDALAYRSPESVLAQTAVNNNNNNNDKVFPEQDTVCI